MEEASANSKITSLTTLSAALTFENLPDDKKEEALLHWLSTQSLPKQQDFLDRAKQVVNNGVTENTGFYHYVIIHSSLTEMFLSQNFIDVLNTRVEDLIGEDEVMVAFVNYGTKAVAAPECHKTTAALDAQQPKFSNGICFKLSNSGLEEAEHLPMYFQCLDELLDGIIETVHHLVQQDANRLFDVFRPLRKSENRITYDFDIVVDGQKRHFLYIMPVIV